MRTFYFSKYYSKKSIQYLVVILLFSSVLLHSIMAAQWLLFTLLAAVSFFYYANRFSKHWMKYSEKQFKRKLFQTAFFIRLLVVVFLYYYFLIVNGEPFEFYAADAPGYHNEALWALSLLKDGNFQVYLDYIKGRFSDSGYPVYLIIVYQFLFSSVFLTRILKAFIGAYTCVLIYKIAIRNFGKETGRIAAVLAMLLPNLIYYCALHVKETEMVFLVVAFFERADYLVRTRKFKFRNIFSVGVLNVTLFTFRTVLGVAGFISLYGALLFTSKKIGRWNKRFLTGFWVAAIVFVFLSEKITLEIAEYWEQRNMNQVSQMQHFSTREGANRLAEYGSAIVFAPIILFAPFPTFVNVEGQENQMMLAGAYYTRNIYAFFVLIGLLVLLKKKLIRNHLLILFFVFLYLGILANSGFALSERFHLPAVPLLLILAAFGITQMNRRYKRYFIPYMIVISIIILGWNWFKLAGRGLV